MKRLVLFTLIAALFLNACKKEEPKVVGYDIKNLSSKRVQATIYSSEEDYINQINPLWQGSVDAGKTTTIPESTLEEGYRYQIDWYSDDQTYSNWIAGEKWLNNEMHFTPSKNSAYIIRELGPTKRAAECNIRGTLLDNNKPTVWKAVDAYSFSLSGESERIWDNLDDWEKKVFVTFSFKTTQLKTLTSTGGEHIRNLDMLDFETDGSNNNGVFTISNYDAPFHVSNTANVFDPMRTDISTIQKYTATRDTLCVVIDQVVAYFMVRQ